MEGDSRDASADQAAWRDLVARFESPTVVDAARAPWPDRENVGDGPGSTGPGSTGPGSTGPRNVGPASTAPGATSLTNHGRVIKPAIPNRSDNLADRSRGSGADVAGHGLTPPDGAFGPRGLPGLGPGPTNSTDSTSCSTDSTGLDPTAADPTAADSNAAPHSTGDTADDERGQDLDLRYLDFDDDDEERYVPPPVPPLPRLDPVARGAWTALFGGPGYLVLAMLLNWQVPGWAELAAILAFVTGFVVLVFRLGNGPSAGDGPDQGAVVLPAGQAGTDGARIAGT